MAGRIRTFKPEVLEDAILAGLTDREFRTWFGMHLLADDYGNLRAHPSQLKGAIFWLSDTSPKDIEKILARLSRESLLVRFRRTGQDYAHIMGWVHQKVDHPGKPRCPSHEDEECQVFTESEENPSEILAKPSRESRSLTTTSYHDHDHDHDRPRLVFDFDALYSLYPLKKGKASGITKLQAKIKTQADYDAVLSGIRNFSAECKRNGTEKKFIPHFSTWVNQHRWEDEPDTGKASNGVVGEEDLIAEMGRKNALSHA